MQKKHIIIVVCTLVIVALLGFFAVDRLKSNSGLSLRACTMEAKLCPDGSAVGRTGPHCEFAECPDTIPVLTSPATVPIHETNVTQYGKVTLGVSEIATFRVGSMTLVRVFDDSRCPSSVTCVRAGSLKGEILLKMGTESWTETIEMGKSTYTGGLKISILSATPLPKPGVIIKPSDYELTLEVIPTEIDTQEPTPLPPVQALGKCYKGGCSNEICSDRPDIASTCIYRAEFQCYQTATCERQVGGECGWTKTKELAACLTASPAP